MVDIFAFIGLLLAMSIVPFTAAALLVLVPRLVHSKVLNIFRQLRSRFGFKYKKGIHWASAPAKGRIDGYELSVQKISPSFSRYFRIRLHGRTFLPPPLEMRKGDSLLTDGVGNQAGYRLSAGDFSRLNAFAGRTVLDREMLDRLRLIEEKSVNLALSADGMTIILPYRRTGADLVLDIVAAAAGLASGFRDLAVEGVDLAATVLNAGLRSAETEEERLNILRLLIGFCKSHPQSRATLERLADGTEFETGYLAAMALERDLVLHLRESSPARILGTSSWRFGSWPRSNAPMGSTFSSSISRKPVTGRSGSKLSTSSSRPANNWAAPSTGTRWLTPTRR